MKEYRYGDVRVQLLSEEIVRIEYGKNGVFCDRDTFFIPDRSSLDSGEIDVSEDNGVISFGKYELKIPPDGKGISGIKLYKNGAQVYSHKKKKNSGELPPLGKTPEVFALSDTPRIIPPEGGYTYRGNIEYSGYSVEENACDAYLILCEKDAKKLRRLYVALTGKSEFVRLSVLGSWNSKYYPYSDGEARQLILDYESHKVPLDNMVIDTDWRSCTNGWGYDINASLFPDMGDFLDFAHSHGVEIMFNDHPEPVDGKNVFDPEEVEYRERNLQSLMNIGLDTWWYDRNWPTRLVSPSENLRCETLGLYLFEDITRNFYRKKSGDDKIYRRPVVMGNAVDVLNGKYQGISDSASHRYGIQWTGDIMSDSSALAQEVYNLIRCGNNCIAYINADCGGHLGNPDKEGFIRWMQFGTLSPVFRPHCTLFVERTREPWVYDGETLDIVREYNNLRYRLLPVIYKNAYLSYTDGIPAFRALGWEYPADKRALNCKDAYMLGNDILISPVADKMLEPLEKKHYAKPVKAVYYNGTKCEGEPVAEAEYDVLFMKCNFNSPEENVPVYDFSAIFETSVCFDDEVKLILRCDDGATVWVDGKEVLRDDSTHFAMNFELAVLAPGVEHSVKVRYFQAGGQAECSLHYVKVEKGEGRKVYLPEGKWLDVFSGKTHVGKKTAEVRCTLKECPIFVRLGSLLPLATEARNTKEQKWDKLIYDFYPDKESSDSGYLYEDDGETTAYKYGQFRTCAYEAEYCGDENCFNIKFHAAKGSFEGERACDRREVTIKYHLLKGVDKVERVTVNGQEVAFGKVDRDEGAFPLNSGDCAPDGDVVIVKENMDVNGEYNIKFFLAPA